MTVMAHSSSAGPSPPPTSSPTIRVHRHTEAAHDEVFIRLTKGEMSWPSMLPAVDALETWISEHTREPAGPLRQVLIADQRSAAADTAVCDLTIPLHPRPTPSTG